ncbi:MAG TPA: glycosyltransferase family A protein [Mucilaginibacter sp.]|nr:glycosyltransferase family A protein [Mucilaginibacter sp.]
MDTIVKAPLVSVIMPVYNCGMFVAEAIESILKQTFREFELIIVDDHSSDNTVKLIESYHDQRINLVKKERNTGYVDSLNLAIQISRGKFLARMDGDDICVATRLEKQVRLLYSDPEIALCGTWYQLIPSNTVLQLPVDHEEIKIALLDYCALGHPTVMIRKNFIEDNKLNYRPEFRPAEDYELWTRIAPIGKMANIPEVLLFYRTHEQQVSNREQENRLEHSLAIRAKMLCYPLAEFTDRDFRIGKVVAGGQKTPDIAGLTEVMDWLDRLNIANTLTSFFAIPQFSAYIEQKKAAFVRAFYLNTTPYNPSVLFRFLKEKKRFAEYLSELEQVKLALKCLFFWKPGLQGQ